MADYWKSQAKKFCKFCKCWIADNKPSIEFHEGGSRHKENVAKRISEISKKSREEYESNKNIDNEMKKMEEAAMKAYLKDVEAEADYTSKIIKEKAMQKNLEEGGTSEEKELVDIAFRVKESAETTETEKKEEKKVWWEAKSDEGHTYYWNTESGESVWEPPEDGYVSLAEQKEEAKRAEKAAKRKKATDEMKKKEEEKQISEEKQARIQREKMKEIYGRKEKEEAKEKPKMSAPIGPAPRIDPYGSWKVIEKKEFKPVDLQLPEQEFIPIKVPTLTEEPKVKFKEKTVATGTIVTDDDDEVSVSGFKKRKAAPGVKRNMRQRLDED
ncbi:WW domain-binding protein 4 [Schistocerca americana]|uniref:WW domain-binding protein 4 n=1 Tax=Schistocerca americana TaxID=7009 RepID=UPI001F4F44A4|nr:WW domain-binding protein 4 [Schistocerca americana]XP_049939477.1 WW domain-binding protein 4 [Schistocerca serialis cubense]